jgi:hypothetical protein
MSITVMNPGGGTVDPKMRNEAGRMLARYCGVEDLWTDAGPAALLREMAHERVPSALRREHFVLLRVALDFYDGTGNIGFAEAFHRLDGCMDAIIELSEFIGAMCVLPESFTAWVESRRDMPPGKTELLEHDIADDESVN